VQLGEADYGRVTQVHALGIFLLEGIRHLAFGIEIQGQLIVVFNNQAHNAFRVTDRPTDQPAGFAPTGVAAGALRGEARGNFVLD